MIKFYSKTEKYRKLKDSELRDMTPGQRMKALEQEYEKAERNRKKVARVPKALSTLTGAGLGALVGSKAGAGAAAGAITGGLMGYEGGSMLGNYVAEKKGHDPEKRIRKLARRIDRVTRKKGELDLYENEAAKRSILGNIVKDTSWLRENSMASGALQ